MGQLTQPAPYLSKCYLVLETVAQLMNVSPMMIVSPSRQTSVREARMIFCVMMRCFFPDVQNKQIAFFLDKDRSQISIWFNQGMVMLNERGHMDSWLHTLSHILKESNHEVPHYCGAFCVSRTNDDWNRSAC